MSGSSLFLINIFFKKEKGISPLIAIIILVVVSVAIIGIVFSWGKSFTNNSLVAPSLISSKSDIEGFIWPERIMNNTLLLRNYHSSSDIRIIPIKSTLIKKGTILINICIMKMI